MEQEPSTDVLGRIDQDKMAIIRSIIINPQIPTENQNAYKYKPKSWVFCDKMGKARISITEDITFLFFPILIPSQLLRFQSFPCS